jgi:hypothetical protein
MHQPKKSKAAQGRRSPKAGAKFGQFVVCRVPVKGSVNVGPRFGPGRWTKDPAKSQIYGSKQEALEHSHAWDKVLSLAEAVKLVAKGTRK